MNYKIFATAAFLAIINFCIIKYLIYELNFHCSLKNGVNNAMKLWEKMLDLNFTQNGQFYILEQNIAIHTYIQHNSFFIILFFDSSKNYL